MSKTSCLMLAAFAGLLLSACSDYATETRHAEPRASNISVPDQLALAASERPAEVPMVHLARQIPGFGGLYVSDGSFILALTDEADASEAITRASSDLPTLTAAMGIDDRGISGIQIRQAQYEFLALQEWRDRLNWDVLAVDGVVFTSLSNIDNRVVIGVRNETVRAAVVEVISRLAIPPGAVHFEYTDYFRPNQTLKDRRRPIEGGLLLPRLGDTEGSGCTLGFNARWANKDVFVTASHCSSQTWSTDYTQYFQHLGINDPLYYVGYEYFDPSPSKCGFLWLKRCRWSDAAIVLKAGHVDSNRGYIARTTGLGSLVIDPGAPIFTIVAGSTWGLAGVPVQMIGSASGWVAGTITHNCADTQMGNSNRIVKCQAIASHPAAMGDSGAPVFGLSPNGAYLFGLHWGSNPSGSAFSWLGGIEKDMGSLVVTPPGPTPPPPPPPQLSVQIQGPSEARPYDQCLFSAIVSGGTPGTYNWKVDGVTIGTQQLVYHSAASDYAIEVTVFGSDGSFAWTEKDVVVSHSAPECLDM